MQFLTWSRPWLSSEIIFLARPKIKFFYTFLEPYLLYIHIVFSFISLLGINSMFHYWDGIYKLIFELCFPWQYWEVFAECVCKVFSLEIYVYIHTCMLYHTLPLLIMFHTWILRFVLTLWKCIINPLPYLRNFFLSFPLVFTAFIK